MEVERTPESMTLSPSQVDELVSLLQNKETKEIVFEDKDDAEREFTLYIEGDEYE